MKVQILDDVKGRFNWFSEVITIMRENNINRSDISNIEISKKTERKFHIYFNKKFTVIQDREKIKDICII